MTEDEYIDSSNMAKLEMARNILNDCMFSDEDDQSTQSTARHGIVMLIKSTKHRIDIKEP